MRDIILSSERLYFQKIEKQDFLLVAKVLQNKEVMYAWEHAFSDAEVCEWIEKNLKRYEADGYGYLLAFEKVSNNFIGVMGILKEEIEGNYYFGIGYILDKVYWGKGYAVEGANACLNYAFNELGAIKVIAQIRPENISSKKVAEKLGMKVEGEFSKFYKGKEMKHFIYSIEKV